MIESLREICERFIEQWEDCDHSEVPSVELFNCWQTIHDHPDRAALLVTLEQTDEEAGYDDDSLRGEHGAAAVALTDFKVFEKNFYESLTIFSMFARE